MFVAPRPKRRNHIATRTQGGRLEILGLDFSECSAARTAEDDVADDASVISNENRIASATDDVRP